MKGFFVTGTDTGIGKTYFTLACISALQQAGYKTLAMKPVASGAEWIDGQLRNEDALLIQQTLNHAVDYDLINPYAFAAPVSPHIAAQQAGVEIDLQHIKTCYQQFSESAEFVIVEGVGGWLAPLTDQLTVADMAATLALPVVLVVGIRLGCLNHAMLTAQAIRQTGLSLSGWVANVLQPAPTSEQIDYLSQSLGMSPLARLAWGEHSVVDYHRLIKLTA